MGAPGVDGHSRRYHATDSTLITAAENVMLYIRRIYARSRIRRIAEILGLAAHHRWNATAYKVIALHLGNASKWRL